MTDKMIPADKVQEVIEEMNGALSPAGLNTAWERRFDAVLSTFKARLEALLPDPPKPTLADMTTEERRECKWMQADTKDWGIVIIVRPCENGVRAGLLDQQGNMYYVEHPRVTPRPDLPRMEWPGNQKHSPALPDGWRLADHPEYGRVMVTNATPGYEGHVCFMHPNFAKTAGYDLHYCNPADLTFLDTTQEKKND